MDNTKLRSIPLGNAGDPAVNRMNVCRVCLCSNLRLYDINISRLSDVFNTFIDVPEWCSDKLPRYICVYCRSLLLKCVEFKSKCRKVCNYFYERNWETGEIINQLKSEVMKFTISEVVIVDFAPEEVIIPTRNDYVDIIVDPMAVKAEKYENYDVDDRIEIGEMEINAKTIATNFEHMFVDQIVIKNEEAKEFKGESATKATATKHSLNELIDNVKLENHFRNSISVAFERISSEDAVKKTNTNRQKAINTNKKSIKTQTVNNRKSRVNKSTKKKALDDSDCMKKNENDNGNTKTNENYNFIDNDIDNDDCIIVESEEDSKASKSDAEKGTKTEIKTKKKQVRKKIFGPRKRNGKQKFEEDFVQFSKLYEVDVKFLTKEEQLERVSRRKADIENGIRKYKFCCNLCYKEFASDNAFAKHNLGHDVSQGEYVCDICHLRYISKFRLWSHLRYHKTEFTCRLCNAMANSSYTAKAHYLGNHAGTKFECQHCSKQFNSLNTKHNHVTEKHSILTCDVCNESLVGSIALNKHKTLMHGASTRYAIRCSTCGVVFQSTLAYKRHRPNDKCDVTSGRLYCGVCGDSFENESDLNSHKNMKHDKNNFQCKECNDFFISERALALHWNRVHVYDEESGEKVNSKMKKVQKVYPKKVVNNPNAQVFMCEVCGRSYDLYVKLKYHMMSHTGERPHKCTLCNKAFKIAAELREHQNLHTGNKPYKCDMCPEAFHSYARRYQHKIHAHCKRRHMCSLCGKAFKIKQHLVAHMLTHTREKPYACNLCEKSYRCLSALKEHRDSVHLGLPHRRMRKRIQNLKAVPTAGMSNEGE